jgi:asparaginyl-tRNA synthetase
MNYPKDIKAFYMRQNDDGKTVAAMDILAPGIGEIVGGSQREERLERLDARMDEMGLHKADYWWYRDLRRYGTVPHAGFGLGFERAIIYATGMANIRDVIPFPRAPKTASSWHRVQKPTRVVVPPSASISTQILLPSGSGSDTSAWVCQ